MGKVTENGVIVGLLRFRKVLGHLPSLRKLFFVLSSVCAGTDTNSVQVLSGVLMQGVDDPLPLSPALE